MQSSQDDLLVIIGELATETLGVRDLRLKAPDKVLQAVERFDALLLCVVLRRELFNFAHHAIDVFLRQTALLVGDRNRLRFSCALIGSRHFEDTVGVNLGSNLNLRQTTRCSGDTSELELAEEVVVYSQRAFTLVNLDQDSWPVVCGGREDLCFARGDDGVTRDKLGENSTSGPTSSKVRGRPIAAGRCQVISSKSPVEITRPSCEPFVDVISPASPAALSMYQVRFSSSAILRKRCISLNEGY